MKLLLASLALGLAITAAPASAQRFVCRGTTNSPYLQFVSTYHDHQRVAPAASGLSDQFTSFSAVFDDADDDDGDGQPDLRLNPEYVVYELRGLALGRTGNFDEPPVSIDRPNKWYASLGLVPLVEAIQGVTNRRLDDSYSGAGTVWNRGHLAMSDHAQRISPEAGCNTHVFWNASPQAADLNQGPWLHLENYSAAASNKYRSIWVIAGPIFDPTTPKLTIGDPGELKVEIPDAFFKILIHESPSGIDTLAFIFEQPNALGADGKPVPTQTWVNIFISSEPDELGEEGPGETHELGYQRCGEADLIIIKTDETTFGLMRPGVQFKVTLRWWTSDNDCDIFTLVQIELEVDKA